MQINDDKNSIRRNPDLPIPELSPELMEQLKEKSLYVVSEFIILLIIICRQYSQTECKMHCIRRSVYQNTFNYIIILVTD